MISWIAKKLTKRYFAAEGIQALSWQDFFQWQYRCCFLADTPLKYVKFEFFNKEIQNKKWQKERKQ